MNDDRLAFERVVLPDNVEVVLSDSITNDMMRGQMQEALEWRTARLKWDRFAETYIRDHRERLRKFWSKLKPLPIGGYVEYQSARTSKYLPRYKLYIVEANIINVSKLFAVSAKGDVFNVEGNGFQAQDPNGPYSNAQFADFIRKQKIIISDANSAIESGKLVEELVRAPDAWQFLKRNTDSFALFRADIFGNSFNAEDPDWRWYAQKHDSGWAVSRDYIGPPASTMMPPCWLLAVDKEDSLIDVKFR